MAVQNLSTLLIRAVTPDDWPAFEAFFEGRGGPKHCWCMVWRKSKDEARQLRSDIEADKAVGWPTPGRRFLKSAMRERITGGVPVGLLAYDGDTPIAWCSVAPRPTYRGLGGPEDLADEPGAVWSIACFFVAAKWRGAGLTRRLIDAAAEHARDRGAKVLEAYPVAADSPSYRFMGRVPVFAEAGFSAVGAAGKRRNVMRKAL